MLDSTLKCNVLNPARQYNFTVITRKATEEGTQALSWGTLNSAKRRMEVVDRKIVVRYCLIVLEWAKMHNLLCVNDFHSTGQKGRDSAGRGLAVFHPRI